MRSFFNQRRTRYITTVMLFVWLLALGTGIVNACLVQVDHARHGHLSHQDATTTAMLTTTLDDSDQDASPGKLLCRTFCASGQTGMVKQPGDVPTHMDVGLALGSVWTFAELLANHASPIPAHIGSPWVERPVFIRFLRLTI